MTAAQRVAFVNELSATVAREAAKTVVRPECDGWDGHEMRVFLAEAHARSAGMSIIRREPRSRRARAYRNAVLVASG